MRTMLSIAFALACAGCGSDSSTNDGPLADLSSPTGKPDLAAHSDMTMSYNDMTAMVDQSTAPVDQSTAPSDQSTAPSDQSTAPMDQSTAPSDMSRAPMDQSTAPSDMSRAPMDQSTAPSDMATASDMARNNGGCMSNNDCKNGDYCKFPMFGCGLNGACMPKGPCPQFCGQYCGCDGKNYCNECIANEINNVAIAHAGNCP